MSSKAVDPFEGEGGLAALMRSRDWASTPVGPPSQWSPALRTMVASAPESLSALLWWGPELVQFYNDAHRPIPGDKHPRCLGQAARECWPEIWDVIGPMIEAPFSGLPATWSDDLLLVIMRSGFPEETHFKVAYSPVPDETVAGTGLGGVLATVSEITAHARAYEEAHERADRAKTLVFSNVSHEFRTPLALMLGPTQDASDRRRREAHGFDAHLLKPVDLKTLSSLLASLLQGQDAS